MTTTKKIVFKDREAALKNFQSFKFGPEEATEFIPTGHVVLDQTIASGHIMSKDAANVASETTTGGFPRGKLVELYGGQGSGKSSLAYRVCGFAQQLGGVCCWFDAERSFSPLLAAINGVDMKYIGRYDAERNGDKFYGEAILDAMVDACNNGAAVVVLDSVANLLPKAVLENSLEKDTIGLIARMLSKSLPKLAHAAAKSKTCVILINQLRTKIGTMYGSPDTTTGGLALPHACSVIIKMNKLNAKDTQIVTEDDYGNEVIIAQTSNCFLEKNRFGQPYREAIPIPIYFKPYFPDFEEILFNSGRQCKAISIRNDVYSWGGLKAEGRKLFIETLKKEGKVDELVAEVKAVSAAEGRAIPPELLNYDQHLATKAQQEEKKKSPIAKATGKKKASKDADEEKTSVTQNPEL